MPKLLVNTCCGCIDLRTGCLILGYLQLISEVLGVILLSLVVAGSGVLVANQHVVRNGIRQNQFFSLAEQATLENATGAFTTAVLVVCVIYLIMVIIGLAFTITFLVGIHENKRGHIKAYLIYSIIVLVLAAILFFIIISYLDVLRIISIILSFALQIYFLTVIRSYYHKMNEGNNKPPVYSAA